MNINNIEKGKSTIAKIIVDEKNCRAESMPEICEVSVNSITVLKMKKLEP